ncbi:hemicentin-1-like [Mytilus californianus]|uniref:hemicentin-1-like n=1 Tax=Mytilus californianus TaxID=6549 RepID=UPI0022467C5C|nr:hemicentin-1-like [Mytilus californianus]
MTCFWTSKPYVLHTLVFLSLTTLSFCQSPGYTVITGPTFKVEGDSVSLTCNSTYGTQVYWYQNNQLLDDSWTTANGVTTNTYTFLAEKTHHLALFECTVDNVLSSTWYFQVYTKPNHPTLTGPQVLILGTTYQWTCISTGGIPSPSMTMWIGDSQFNYNISSINTDIKSELQSSDKTYTVNFTLSWAPSISYNGLTLYCHVQHPETSGNSRQTDSLLLTVNAEPNHPTLTGSQILILGTTYQWTCISTGGIPSPLMTMWIGNSQINTGITQSSILQSDGTYSVTSTLSWAPNIRDNGQTLYCHVQHPATRVNKTVSLQLTVNEPLSVNATPTQYQQNIGTTITLNCVIIGTATSITWYFNNQVMNIASSSKYSNGNTINPSLTISNIALSDTGLYICQATNGVETANSNTITLTVLDLLTVNIPQSSYSVLTGQQITIPCTVAGTPTQTNVFWRKVVNGVQTNVVINGNSRYTGGTTATPSLTITNTQSSDEGTYVCFATNSVGTSNSQNTFLDVTGGVPIVTIGGSNFQVQVGNSITIGCTVTANPVVTSVYWTRDMNGQTTNIGPSSNPSKYGGSTTVTPSLTIYNVDFSDEGNYQCFATNSIGTGSSRETSLDVQGGVPTVQISLPNYQVNFGSSITLVCLVVSNPAHFQVYWRRTVGGTTSNIDVTNSGGKYSGSTVSTPSLTINNAASSDEASYICYATNSVGTGQSISTSLTVVGNIPTVTVQQTIYNVNYGNSAVLVCSVTANPAHTIVYWRKIKNGVSTDIDVVNSNNKYSGSTVSNPSLQIYNADLNDEANYVCFASNSVGTGQSSQTFLDVIGDISVVTISSNIYSVLIGGTVTLQCTVSSNPAHTSVTWQRIVNGVLTTVIVDGSRIIGSTVSTPSLTISNAVSVDEGNYICTATNIVGTGTSQQTFLDVTGNIPTVTVAQNQYSANYGQTVTMVCTVQANPTETSVYWRKLVNGQMTSIDMNNVRYTGSTVGSPSLTISALELSDEGYYQCYAQNSVGTGSSQQTFLDVIGAIPVVTIPQSQYSVNVGSSVTMVCTISANPVHTSAFWHKVVNGVATNINLSQTSKYSGSTTTSPSLTVLNAVVADEGYYTCSAQNSVGTGTSSQTFLGVSGSVPVVTVLSTSYSINVGNSITLQCTVNANPTASSVTWQRNINNVATNIDMSIGRYSGSSVGSPSLVISNTVISDEGFYICTATNNVGSGQSQQTFLDVIGSIPTVTVPQSTYGVNRGSSVTLQCTYTANPAATSVIWERTVANQVTTISTASNKYDGSTTQSPSLLINNTDESDEANYVCKVTNSVGTGISSSTFLDVLGNVPAVTTPTAAYTVNVGDSVTITCTVTANPQHTTVYWQYIAGGSSTNVNIGGRFSGSSVSSPSLIIFNAQLSDQGSYVCYATNSVGTGQSSQVVLAVTGSIPSVSLTQTSFTGNYGDTFTLGCTVSANPAVTSVYWQKVTGSTTATVDMSNSRYTGSSVSTPSLTITNLNSNDAGNYICLAVNSVGTGQSLQGPLTVIGNVPIVTVSQSTYSTNIGNTITLDCVVSANPAHTAVYWTRQITNGNTVTLNPASSAKYSGSTTQSPSLTISNVDTSDEGNYICHATNAVGTGQSSQTFLDVIGNIPTVTASIISSAKVANPVTITCTVTATPAATQIVWQRYVSNAATTMDISSIRYSGGTTSNPSLIINSVQEGDQGLYFCQASNSVGTGTSNNVYLTVTGDAPTSIAIRPSPITVNEGQTITATCTAQGSPTITYTWFKGNSNTQLSTGSVLQITSSTRTDAGTYQCRASNTYGNADATVTVEVQYIPDVTITQPFQGFLGQAITIQCSYVSNPGATNVIWSKGNQGITVDGNKYVGGSLSNPSLTITNLAASDQGSYRCSVVNSVGQGYSSSVTILVDTSTAPSYIRIVPACLVVNEGESFTLTCEADGDPAPTFNWYQHDVLIHQGAVLSISNANWTIHDGLNVCKATNTKGSRQTWESVNVQHKPVSTVTQTRISQIVGSPVSLSCDTRANPSATEWQWFYNGYFLSSTSKVLVVDMDSASDAGSYTCRAMNGVGTSSDIAFNIAILTGTEGPTVTDPAGPATGASITDTAMLSTGEIVAILLAILFVLLLIIGIIVCCCCQETCATLCGGKKERITPQDSPKRVEIPVYYREPDESVISLRKLEIPTFKQDAEQPVKHNVYSELPVRMARPEKHNVYSRHPEDDDEEYVINKYHGYQSEDNEKLEQRERSIDNTYSDITCTYEEEERRRKRRRRKKKKNKRLRDEVTVEDGIENGDALRSKVRSRRSKHRTLRTSRDHEQGVMIGEKFYYEQE